MLTSQIRGSVGVRSLWGSSGPAGLSRVGTAGDLGVCGQRLTACGLLSEGCRGQRPVAAVRT